MRSWRGYLWAVVTAAAATGLCFAMHRRFEAANLIMVYLLGVVGVAAAVGRGPAVCTSLLSVACFDFFFVEPRYTFAVANTQYVFTFAVMLCIALLISAMTDRLRRQADDSRAAWELIETEFLRNTLLSSVSHDLRTPLAAITGAASSLVEAGATLPEETRRELAEMIGTESERMERLINNLLDMTRLEAGGAQPRKECQPISEVIGSALRHVERRLRGRVVTVDVAADLPLAMFDAVSIDQVLVNLIENAVQYTPASAAIEIRARLAGGAVGIEVADRGPGLPAGSEGRVFQKFFRARSAEPGAGPPGIGLGLAICRGIIEAHGGSITAFNREGGGAAFRFTLPLCETPPQPVE